MFGAFSIERLAYSFACSFRYPAPHPSIVRVTLLSIVPFSFHGTYRWTFFVWRHFLGGVQGQTLILFMLRVF